jgi:predicted GIY-YIG superfamily endonuclease
MFWTYLLRCSDCSFYCGHTDNLEIRIADHHGGKYRGYTHKRRPLELAWSQDFTTRHEALAAERQIKGWSRAKKQALVGGDWRLVSELAQNRQARAGRPRASTSSARTDVCAHPKLGLL